MAYKSREEILGEAVRLNQCERCQALNRRKTSDAPETRQHKALRTAHQQAAHQTTPNTNPNPAQAAQSQASIHPNPAASSAESHSSMIPPDASSPPIDINQLAALALQTAVDPGFSPSSASSAYSLSPPPLAQPLLPSPASGVGVGDSYHNGSGGNNHHLASASSSGRLVRTTSLPQEMNALRLADPSLTSSAAAAAATGNRTLAAGTTPPRLQPMELRDTSAASSALAASSGSASSGRASTGGAQHQQQHQQHHQHQQAHSHMHSADLSSSSSLSLTLADAFKHKADGATPSSGGGAGGGGSSSKRPSLTSTDWVVVTAPPRVSLHSAFEQLSLQAFGESFTSRKRRIQSTSTYFRSMRHTDVISLIFKHGDDVRQEVMAMQFITLFAKIFSEASLPLQLHPYCVLINSPNSGLIETVKDSMSVDSIKKNVAASPHGASLATFFHYYWGMQGPEVHEKALRNFVESMAAYSGRNSQHTRRRAQATPADWRERELRLECILRSITPLCMCVPAVCVFVCRAQWCRTCFRSKTVTTAI